MLLRLLPFFDVVCIISILLASAPSISRNSTSYAFSSNVTDQQALLSVKSLITGDPLGVLGSWNHSIHFCRWTGVTCSRRRQRVTALDLSFQQLHGSLSPHIGNLTFLRAIYLKANNFYSSIPNEIGGLFRLQYLHLGHNYFDGAFPSGLSHCLDIRNISINNNNLVGKLPATQLASWSKLTKFVLTSNQFTGLIPPSIGNISSLRQLDLSANNLVGSIPLEVARLLKLEYLDLSTNNLSGVVPLPLYNSSSIYMLDLNQNQLEGNLPQDLGFTLLPNIQEFYIDINRISGLFPPSIANASSLVKFDISTNNISGPIPMNLGSLRYLEFLNFGDNQLGHNQPPGDLSFLDSLVNCTSLNFLGANENGFRGELTNSIGNLSTALQRLDLFSNYIYGSIPYEIGKLVNLTQLALADNIMTGKIPESIGQLSKLEKLFLYENKFSGEIPASIGNITGLIIFSSSYNKLQGSIPDAVFNISTLQYFGLSGNYLSGMIPEQIIGLSSQCIYLLLDQNLFTGPLPSNIGSLKHLVELNVSGNHLTGEIPASLGDCVMLEQLDTGGNLFEGRIPSSFKELKSLVLLDLSNNNLSGNIPSFLGGFRLIEFLNLSHNKLVGEVPTKGAFLNLTAFSVIGNLQLCGGIQALQLPACLLKNSGTRKRQFPLRMIPLVVLLPLAVLLACFALVFYQIGKSKQKNVQISVLKDNQYPRATYQDLLLATNGFSESNLLGEGKYGSVYRGVLESLQQTVAVKVLNVEVHGANKSFLAECETLSNIRHRNLIKIITACSSTDFKQNDFKALVFEFMTNGSLESWLHPSPSDPGNERNLNLLQRLNISIDVALAVDYLHHQNDRRIIHCDIKPSNILLDDEFVARVGDFGLARFFVSTTSDINHRQTSSTGVRGTVGYVPPEYGMGGEISAEGDVYSYGVLLLELFTGKRPTSSNILTENANNLHEYVTKALPYRVMEIADPKIILLEQQDNGSTRNKSVSCRGDISKIEVCLASIFAVGILCSVETPRERIDISVAVKQLYVARDILLSHGH